MKMGNYKICQKCCGPIHRNGVLIQKKKGRGWEDVGYYHNHCSEKIYGKPSYIKATL